MTKDETIKVKVYRDDSLDKGFAAYLSPSLTMDGEAVVLINIEATLHACADNDINAKEFIIENIMHEIGHALEEKLKLEFDEDRIEKIIDKYREKYKLKKTDVFKIAQRIWGKKPITFRGKSWIDGFVKGYLYKENR